MSYEHDSDDYPEDYRGDPEPEDARLSEEEAERWPYLASLGEEAIWADNPGVWNR